MYTERIPPLVSGGRDAKHLHDARRLQAMLSGSRTVPSQLVLFLFPPPGVFLGVATKVKVGRPDTTASTMIDYMRVQDANTAAAHANVPLALRSEEHTSELQSR